MSTIDRQRPVTRPPLEAGQRLDRATFHERYLAMPPETRAELINGIVHMPSPMSADHGDENFPVVIWLDHYAESTPGVRGSINVSLLLDDLGEPQPDVCLRILPEYGGRVRHEEGYIVGAPELVVEISRSSLAIDLGAKKDDYGRAGIPEYLVVGLEPPAVHWFVRRGERFEEQAAGPDGILRSEVFPGLWLDPDALYAGDRHRLRAAVDRGLATPEHAAFVARLAEAGQQARGADPSC
jgi:Uma2 family endonuclease